jgi:hypothetical protein
VSDQSDNKLIPFRIVTHFDRARQELELAATVDEVKRIRDQSEALRQYAKQSRLSLDMQNRCAEIRIRAERRGGDMLKAMEKHPPGPIPMGDRSHDATDLPPSLADLGISKSQSSRWQAIASIPDQHFEDRVESLKATGKELTSSEMLSLAAYLQREKERQDRRHKAAASAATMEPDERVNVRHGDFRQVLSDMPDASVDLVLTDPLYSREYLPLWRDLAEFAARVLKPGHLLLTYSGQHYLPEILNMLSEHLNYVWMIAVKHRFPDNAFKQRIKNCWKPVLIFSNGEYQPTSERFWLHDYVERGGSFSTLKRHHPYEQGLEESIYLLQSLTYENDLIVDPFLGSGTTAVAATSLNRRFRGCDVDAHCVNETKRRLSEGVKDGGEMLP